MRPERSRPGRMSDATPPGHAFDAPWQAQLHALTVALHEAGAFGWDEWTAMLARELHRPGVAADGSDDWHRWSDALVALLDAKGLAGADEVRAVAEAWRRAAEATPHGTPIALANDPAGGMHRDLSAT